MHKHIQGEVTRSAGEGMYLINVSVMGSFNRPLLLIPDDHSYSEATQNLYFPELKVENRDDIFSFFFSCSSLLMVGKLGMALLQKPQES